MTLASGSRLGVYEILSPLGSGGMGEVYRARDTKLGREVAIKVLPSSFAADPERLARFEREARLLASLNHPNIAQIYGLERVERRDGQEGRDGPIVPFIVMELVEGETLGERITHGSGRRAQGSRSGPPSALIPQPPHALALDDALAIARQIAAALDAAHERGIVHRDLKPANIAIAPDGTVKVLDFGLAKVDERSPSVSSERDLTHSPTIMALTLDGVLLGTAPYMSPEQARGRAVDKRTDIWAFGCVLFEMLTGRRAFPGETSSDAVAAILGREPDWTALPAETPSAVRRLLGRCLEKDGKNRLRDIGDARSDLDAARHEAAPASPDRTRRADRTGRWIAAGLAALATALAFVSVWNRTSGTPQLLRLSVFAPGQLTPQLSATISPDGRHLTFVSTDTARKSMLWIRDLDAMDARPLAGTENAAHPFWSPDSRSIGFIAEGKLKTTGAAGGPVQTLASVTVRTGSTWNADGLILFKPGAGRLATVPATGGPIAPVKGDDAIVESAFWPFFLPDGRHFLFFAGVNDADRRGIYVGSLDSPETRRLVQTDVKAAYAPPGHLMFVRGDALMAQPFDARRLSLEGVPTPIADGIWNAPSAGQASFSLSQTGIAAYVNASVSHTQLAWFDRQGRPLGAASAPGSYLEGVPQISPDAERIAIARVNQGIWVIDVARGTTLRATFDSARDRSPLWSADGRQMIFLGGLPDGRARAYRMDTGGPVTEEPLFDFDDTILSLEDWSRDGRFIVYTAVHAGSSDIWVLPLGGDRRPFPFLQTPFNKTQARVSPNGRWIAYTSNESGDDQVYVQSFPTPGSKRQISGAGGVQPRWRRDNSELFYLAADQNLVVVPVSDGIALELGRPVALFRTKLVPQGSQSVRLPTSYDVTAGGERFIMNVPPDDPGAPMTVVFNWPATLKR